MRVRFITSSPANRDAAYDDGFQWMVVDVARCILDGREDLERWLVALAVGVTNVGSRHVAATRAKMVFLMELAFLPFGRTTSRAWPVEAKCSRAHLSRRGHVPV